MKLKAPLILLLLVILAYGYLYLAGDRDSGGVDADDAVRPGIQVEVGESPSRTADAPPPEAMRARVANDPPIVVLGSDGAPLRSGLVRLEVRDSGVARTVEIGLGSDFVEAPTGAITETLLARGGLALFAYSSGRKLQVTPPRIEQGASLPIILNELEGASSMLRVVDHDDRVELTSLDLLSTAIPIRPDLVDRSDDRFGWFPVRTQVDSPIHVTDPLSANTWVFRDGYVSAPVPQASPVEGVTTLELHRAGTLELRHGDLQAAAAWELRIGSPSWQGMTSVPVPGRDPVQVELPPGRYDLTLSRSDDEWDQAIWEGTCTIFRGETTIVEARNSSQGPPAATLSGVVRCPGGLLRLQERPLISIYDTTGVRRVKVVELQATDGLGESFTFGPVDLPPGSYRVALTGLAFGESLELRPAQAAAIHWVLPGVATVTFEFIDVATGERLSPQSIGYWQDPTGLAPPEGPKARMKSIGFPTARSVDLAAGLTWFRFGLSLDRPIRIEPVELVPGEQIVTFSLEEDPRVSMTLRADDGIDLSSISAPTFVWARRLDGGAGGPASSPWLMVDAEPAGITVDAMLIQAQLPRDGRWEVVIPPIEGTLQPTPMVIDTASEGTRPEFLLRTLDSSPSLPARPSDQD